MNPMPSDIGPLRPAECWVVDDEGFPNLLLNPSDVLNQCRKGILSTSPAVDSGNRLTSWPRSARDSDHCVRSNKRTYPGDWAGLYDAQ